MTIVIQKRKKFFDVDEYYYEYSEIELETFRWVENHQLEYIKKGNACWSKLEKDEELVGMKL